MTMVSVGPVAVIFQNIACPVIHNASGDATRKYFNTSPEKSNIYFRLSSGVVEIHCLIVNKIWKPIPETCIETAPSLRVLVSLHNNDGREEIPLVLVLEVQEDS
jgi:hypothetical protein